MDFQLGNICHIEMAGGDLARTKEFYSNVFGWKFSPMSPTYEFFDAGNFNGAVDQDAKPSHEGTVLVLACEDVADKLSEIEQAGCKVLKPKTAIAEGHGFYGYFEDPAGNKIGVWQPAKA